MGLRKVRPRIVVQSEYGEQSLVIMDMRNSEIEMKELMKHEEIGAGLREGEAEETSHGPERERGVEG